ncbi:hypothetical protein [Arcanobacterium phocae]|uniref:hypothetical protein n=1 Tax=Arcanobacterium phocae TaxID=131112 RepID=UPI001C0F04A4|nr:hypothetical protein [Arcanobacterium phocae]
MSMVRAIAGTLVGAIAAVLSLVAYSGPLDQPVIGLTMASGLVMSGSWFVYRLTHRLGWCFYSATLVIVTGWMVFFPPTDDILFTDQSWALDAWLILVAISIVLPVIIDRDTPREQAENMSTEIEMP